MRSRVAAIALFLSVPAVLCVNDRPIIGILTQPTSSSLSAYGNAYVAASYVKYVEAGGARAAVVPHNLDDAQLQDAFSQLNGVLFPGGGSSLDHTPLMHAGTFFVNASLAAARNGDIFPVVGHCQGFEMMMAIAAGGDLSVLSSVDAENISLPLDFSSDARDSALFGECPEDAFNALATEPITMNNHQQCVSTETYAGNDKLSSFFRVLSTNRGREGKEFVSSVENPVFPMIYAVQWHPEKPQYEWNPNEGINHSGIAVNAMQYMAEHMVNIARQSSHRFKTREAETASLFYNYKPTYTEKFDPSFEQAYIFNF